MVPPTLVIKIWLKNHMFIFSTSSLKQSAGGTTYYVRRLPKPRPSSQAFLQNFEYGKMQKIYVVKQCLIKYDHSKFFAL